MAKKLTLEQRGTGEDLVAVVRNLRADSPAPTDPEKKKLLKSLAKESCPQGLLLWAAMCGTIEMKGVVASNPSAGPEALGALMLDVDAAPWYIMNVLEREDVLRAFISEVFGDEPPFVDVESLEELIDACRSSDMELKWKSQIPPQGSCKVMQPELIRILWRFGRTLNYCVAYKLGYDDEMFNTLDASIEALDGISLLTKSILRACLRWSQLIQRGGRSTPPHGGFERYDLVEIVVAAYLTRVTDAVSFAATY